MAAGPRSERAGDGVSPSRRTTRYGIEVGSRVQLAAALILLSALSSSAGEDRARLTLSVSPRAPLQADLSGKVTVRPLTPPGEPFTATLSTAGTVTLELPAKSRFEVRAELAGGWVRGGEVEVGAAGSETAMKLPAWPWAKLTGRLRFPKGTTPTSRPRTVTVSTLAAPKTGRSEEMPRGTLTCPLGSKGRFQCRLPAATYDLILVAEGFTPFYRTGVHVGAARPVDLGILTLQRGASVAGWVAVEEGAIWEGQCLARLRPAFVGTGGFAVKASVSQARQEVKVRKDGFFQLVGVTPGSYSLEVAQPQLAPAILPQVDVAAERETFVRDPVVLRRPLRLTLQIDPPLDWLGARWRAQVYRDAAETPVPGGGTVFDGAATEDGQVAVAPFNPGTYSIRVSDSRGNRMSWQDKVQIGSAADARREIRIEYVTVKGTLRLGSEPLSGKLWFGGHTGAPRVEMESGTDGTFHGVVPRAGRYPVDIDVDEPAVTAQTEADVKPDRQGRATVEVRLPATRVFGRVVDDQGSPAEGAQVEVSTASNLLTLEAGSDGTFASRGLPEGLISFAARWQQAGRRWVASPLFVPVTEDHEVGPIEIHLRQTRLFSARVIGPGGPVAGAQLTVTPWLPRGAAGVSRRSTDLEGKVSLEIDGSAEQVAVEVMAAGYPLQVFQAAAGPEATLSLTSERGTLSLKREGSLSEPEGRSPQQTFVFQNGLILRGFAEWLHSHAQPQTGGEPKSRAVEVSDMAPGVYDVCRISYKEYPAWSLISGTPDPDHCTHGTLATGGTLELRLPSGNAP